MSNSSCTCVQKYNLSKEDDVQEKHETTEVVEEEVEEQSSPSTPSTKETEDYDGHNFIPSLMDLFVSPKEVKHLEFNDRLYIRKRTNHRIVGVVNIVAESVDDDILFVGYRGFFPISKKIHIMSSFGYIKLNFDLINEVRKEEHMDMLLNTVETQTFHVYQDEAERKYGLTLETEKYSDEIKNFHDYSYDESVDVITETANLIVMRQMARKDFVGTKSLKYLYLNMTICKMEYKSYEFELCRLNKGFAEVKRVRRRIIMPNNELFECNAYLSKNGQLVLISWRGEKHYAAIHRKAVIKEGLVPTDPAEMIPLRDRIEENPILKSILEEATVKCSMKGNLYVADHPEVKSILSFICKQILLHKPHKVVHYVRRCIAPYL